MGIKNALDITKINGIEFLRVNNSTNGNPRYIFHFSDIAETYKEALTIAKKAGAKKYNSKDFTGCFILSSYSLESDAKLLKK